MLYNFPPLSLLVSPHEKAKCLQQFLTSILISHSSTEERVSLPLWREEKTSPSQKTLTNIVHTLLFSFAYRSFPEPTAMTRKWASLTGLRQSPPFPLIPATEVVSVLPQPCECSGSLRMGNCARKLKMDVPCKSHCKLSLWLVVYSIRNIQT